MANPTNYTPAYPATNDPTGTKNRARVGGSSFTVFTWQSSAIAFARQVSHQSPTPVGPGTVPIHPLDSPYPVELITPQAITMGTLTLELYELYGAPVWWRLSGLGSDADGGKPVDLANIYKAVANTDHPIMVTRIVRPPKMRSGKTLAPYTQEFHNCVVSSLVDGETIEIGTMEVLKQITVNYTHTTMGGKNNLLQVEAGIGVAPPGVGAAFA